MWVLTCTAPQVPVRRWLRVDLKIIHIVCYSRLAVDTIFACCLPFLHKIRIINPELCMCILNFYCIQLADFYFYSILWLTTYHMQSVVLLLNVIFCKILWYLMLFSFQINAQELHIIIFHLLNRVESLFAVLFLLKWGFKYHFLPQIFSWIPDADVILFRWWHT